MTKRPEKSEVEWLRGENRRLKSENRNLKKQLNRRDKKVKAYEEHIDLSVEPDMIEAPAFDLLDKMCQEKDCEGILDKVDLGVKFMRICRSCGARKTYKK